MICDTLLRTYAVAAVDDVCSAFSVLPVLHGAATARCAEQMEVGLELATRLLDRGADVSAAGRHSSLIGSGPDAVNADMPSVRATSLHSYPLMWAVAGPHTRDPLSSSM